MNYYKGILSYKGTKYNGWQKQLNAKSIQGELESVVAKISNEKIENIKVISSGRTDAGVHALAQVVKISTPLEIVPSNFLKGINSLIDDDIKLLSLETCSESFQPVYDVKIKEYKYFFSTSKIPSPLFNDQLTYLRESLSLEKMNEAAKAFVGEHDFVNFYTVGTPVKTSVREIYHCEVLAVDSNFLNFPDNTFVLTISGSGFLKQMVRLIMSAIWSAGASKIEISQIEYYLREKMSDKLAPTAPPQGLYLSKVVY